MAVYPKNSEKNIATEDPPGAVVKKLIRFEAKFIECSVTKKSTEFKVKQRYFRQC